jgi:hypothetical protein
VKSIQQILKNCHVSKPFEERNSYVEKSLEQTLRYFDHINDLGTEIPDAEKLRKKLHLQIR